MTTPVDALAGALRDAAAFNSAAEAAPEAVLWCDAAGEFAPVLPMLRARMPGLLTFGPYDPATRTGPALWLRAAAARQVPGVAWPDREPPAIYLPEVGREVLRDAETCPDELAPLVWFAVAGSFFGQPRQARDWTLRGFLAARGSPVGLDMPDDAPTRTALGRAAHRLFAEPIAAIAGKRWDAAALDGLLVENPDLDMLAWMEGSFTQAADPARFEAFAALASKRFGFDPRKRSPDDAAAKLARRDNAWAKVWERFEAENGARNEVARLLATLDGPPDLLTPPDAYPAENARREASLRASLLALTAKMPTDAARAVRDLDKDHAWRRQTVWARRGEAKLAEALLHLTLIAAAPPLPAHQPDAMAEAYAANGWEVDDAAIRALDLVRTGEDHAAVVAAVRAVYLPWLDSGAVALEALAAAGQVPFVRPMPASAPLVGDATLFVDGLRMDLAHRLAAVLRGRGATVETAWRWSGFPSITATCKALASPAAGLLTASPAADLLPAFEGKPATKPVLVKALEAAGWSTAETLLGTAPVWQEAGRFDAEGHALGARLAERVADGIEEVAGVALRLARAGGRVRIVTDHGWLLMPGALPHAELHAGLVAPSGKANRVAALKERAPTSYTRLPWSWDPSVTLAVPPGARVFYSGTEYAHGGVSPQECVLPVLDVTLAAAAAAPRLAVSVRWRGLMAKVGADGGEGLMADIRLGADGDGVSALLRPPRALDDAGEANLGIDDAHEGQPLCVVLYSAEAPERILARLPTKTEG